MLRTLWFAGQVAAGRPASSRGRGGRSARCGGPTAYQARPAVPPRRMVSMLNLVVAGAHMSGLRLNHQLTDLGAKLLRAVETAPVYRERWLLGPWRLKSRPLNAPLPCALTVA